MPEEDQHQIHLEDDPSILQDRPYLPPSPPPPLHLATQLHEDANLSHSIRAKEPFSVLGRIPNDIQDFREKIFGLNEPFTFTNQEWERYWPFIDNVWCLHNRMDAPASLARGHAEKFWGGCRLQRRWDHQTSNPPPKGMRNRVRRETGTCAAKFKLTSMPDGSRVLERSTKDGHSHDLDHIDSIKRNSGVRSLVLDPFFNSWEPATIMAYLRDPDHFINGRDMLTEAGGKYLERREIMNIFSQHLRKLYPGIDVSAIKKEQDKYKSMKTCNAKGCNRSFADGKALMAHRKQDHPPAELRRQAQMHRQYTCPQKGCHRKKKSKGFPSLLALKEHQLKMEHWGCGIFHAETGPTPCQSVCIGHVLEHATDPRLQDHSLHLNQSQDADPSDMSPKHTTLQQLQSDLSIPQHRLPDPDHTLLPLIAQGVTALEAEQALVPIDPAMDMPHALQQHHHPHNSHAQTTLDYDMNPTHALADELHHRQAMLERLQQLKAEMSQIENQLYS